jgi:hypothetical protein
MLDILLQILIDGLQLIKIDDRFVADAEVLEKRLYDAFDQTTTRLALATKRGEPTVSLSDTSFDDFRAVRIEVINLIERWMSVNSTRP